MPAQVSGVRDRYRNDATFFRLVEYLRSMLRGIETTPSELREAVFLAAYLEEIENPTPALMRMQATATEVLGWVAERDAAEAGDWNCNGEDPDKCPCNRRPGCGCRCHNAGKVPR